MSDEVVDVFDDQGNKTGQALTVQDVHDKKLWHGVSHVWIYNDKGEILLQRRSPTREWAGDKWDLSAGGHMSAGETPLEAAVREAKEEVGLVLDSESLKLVEKCIQNNKQTPNRIHNAYEWNHIAKSNLSGSNVKLQKSEATDAKWMLLDEFERALNDKGASKNYAPRDKKLYTLIIKAIRGVLNND